MYLVHCGFYDPQIGHGLFEGHTNIFICARDFEEAREKVKLHAEFKRLKMHIDSLVEVQCIEGYQIHLAEDPELKGKTRLRSLRYGSRTPKEYEM